MVPNGVSEKNDALKKELLKKIPNLRIRYTNGRYDLHVFNQAASKNWALINITPWAKIHPNLVSVPLNTKISVAYGVLAAKKADSEINNFMAILRRLLVQNKTKNKF